MNNHPFLNKDFKINWSTLKAENILPDMRLAIKRAEEVIETICGRNDEEVTFENTVLALSDHLSDLDEVWDKAGVLETLCETPDIRKNYNEILPELVQFYSGINLNENLWKKIKFYKDTTECNNLRGVKKRLFERSYHYFVDYGAERHGFLRLGVSTA